MVAKMDCYTTAREQVQKKVDNLTESLSKMIKDMELAVGATGRRRGTAGPPPKKKGQRCKVQPLKAPKAGAE